MKKLFLLLMAVVTSVACAVAQNITVTGTVTSAEDGEPLTGATIQAEGTNIGTSADIDGNFSISIPATVKKLRIAYVGFEHQIVDVAPVIKVALKPTTLLDEVMVVAYGTAKKSAYTGSASVVKADQLEDALVASATQALTGKVSGVQVQSSNGQPGTAPTIRIRGVGSINAVSSPLYVVDGMPYEGDISSINTQDIESMTVLKDAASTALYGERGANGVILITTKKGSRGDAKVTVDARWGVNTRALPRYDLISDSRQYLETTYQGMVNGYMGYQGMTAQEAHVAANNNIWSALGYQTWTVPQGQTLIGSNGKFNPNATPGYSDGTLYYIADDWFKESLTNGFRQDYNISISGGSDKINYYLSASYLDDGGIVANSHFKRLSTRANIEYQAKNWLKIGTNLSYTYADQGYPGDQTSDGDTSANVFYVANLMGPVYPMYVRNADGSIQMVEQYNRPVYDYGDGQANGHVRAFSSMSNPAGSLAYDREDYLMDILDGKWYATINPIEGLNVTGTVGYRVDNTRMHYLANNLFGQSANYGGQAIQDSSRYRNLSLQAIAQYNRTFADVHNVGIMAGYESQDYYVETVTAQGQNLYNPDNFFVDNTIDNKNGYGNARTLAHRGIIGRVEYNYDTRYYFMASIRRGASSRFAPENRWGTFWSASIGWDIAKEEFMRDFNNVDMLKFRASFGQNGNDVLGSSSYYWFAYADQYRITGADGVWSDGTLAFKGNRDITWEKSNAFNVGVDYSFFQGKVAGSVEYFNRQTDDMLFNVPVTPSLGYSSIPMNVGSMRNNGFELEVNYRPIETRDITWDINFNITLPSNKVLKLEPSIINENGEWISGNRYFKEGESMYNLYLVKWGGVDAESGDAMYWTYGNLLDSDGNKIPDGTDENGNTKYKQGEFLTKDYDDAYNNNRQATGNIMPKAYGGFSTSIKAYGVDFSASFAYQLGGKILDYTYQGLMSNGLDSQGRTTYGQAMHKDLLNAWTPENTNTDVPRLTYQDQYHNATCTSTRFLTSSNYLSLTNVTLGYTFPEKLISKLGLKELRIYGAAENVALWSKRKGLDPRQGFVSSENTTYSPVRAISGGLRVSF